MTPDTFTHLPRKSLSSGRSITIPLLRGMRLPSFHLTDGGRPRRPVALSHRGQIDAREGECSTDPDRDSRHLVEEDPSQQARSNRLANETQAHDRRGDPPKTPVV